MAVDSISLPRDTLQRITGDCDDLTVLYNSLLETVGVETGYITTPGHIFSVFNTTTPSRSYGEIHPERNMTININGELWLPVEITIIGRAGFLAAWRRGVEEWHLYSESPERRGLYTTRSSQQLYRSVGLKETDLGLQYGNIENIQQLFKRDMTELVDLVVKEHADRARNSGKKSDFNKLGITYAQFSQYAKAERAFQDALAIDPDYLSALANLGNIAYMQADYETALSLFEKTLTMLQARGKGNSTMALKVLINISRTHYEMKQYERAKEYFNLASSIDASETEKYAYIKSTGSGEARAFDVSGTGSQVLFLDSDE
jgi:hypothetical protein